MADLEKKGSSDSSMEKDPYYTNEAALIDPEEKKSLHRDLSARQISMIAVRLSLPVRKGWTPMGATSYD